MILSWPKSPACAYSRELTRERRESSLGVDGPRRRSDARVETPCSLFGGQTQIWAAVLEMLGPSQQQPRTSAECLCFPLSRG